MFKKLLSLASTSRGTQGRGREGGKRKEGGQGGAGVVVLGGGSTSLTADVVASATGLEFDLSVVLYIMYNATHKFKRISTGNVTRGQSNLTKSASRGAHSPVRGHPRGSKVVPLNSWGRVSY